MIATNECGGIVDVVAQVIEDNSKEGDKEDNDSKDDEIENVTSGKKQGMMCGCRVVWRSGKIDSWVAINNCIGDNYNGAVLRWVVERKRHDAQWLNRRGGEI